MKINRIFNKVALASMITSLVTPLAILVPRVSAAPDTCTWTGTTGVEDVPTKSWTFNMNDASNWSGCDNGMIPEDGDSLVFPAGLAVVDPDNSEDDDYAWAYKVNNDLADGISFANITFSGATNDDYNVYADTYVFVGNSISLSGDVDYSYTGTNANSKRPQFQIAITTTAPVTITADVSGGIDSGSNDLTLCDPATPELYTNIGGELNVGGTLIIGCSVSLNTTYTSSIGNITVEADAQLNGDPRSFAKDASQTITVKDGAQLSFYGYAVNEELVIPVDIVYQGGGSSTGYCTSSDYTKCGTGGEAFVEVNEFRGYWQNSYYDSVTKKSLKLPIKVTGDITLSSDTVLHLSSNTTVTGAINGNYSLEVMPGSRGTLTTSKGTVKPEYITYSLSNVTSDVYLNYGYKAVLTEANKVGYKVTVPEGAILSGIGEVDGIEVQDGGTLAPGNSPGCITSTSDLVLAGTFSVEIEGSDACTGYDRTTVTGSVDISGGTLDVTMLDSFNPTLNQEFVIIDNDAADAVVGTFTGLAEGASIEINGVTLAVSYVGGDGNDVVLSATAVPATETAPDTGIGSIISNPLISLLALSLTGATLVGLRKVNLNKK